MQILTKVFQGNGAELWAVIVVPIIIFLVAFILGFILARQVIKKLMEKNPPVTENMIRAMMTQMGRTPSEKQVRQVMNSMNKAKEEDKKKKK